jgi:NAD(P)-dependent dehydrogenase (short-subunit alcohol dehydrogenase family)
MILNSSEDEGETMTGVLEGKIAIVTGASQGVGKGEAMALAKEGAKVAVLARRYDGVVAVAQAIEAIGGEALPIACDVCSVEQVNAAVAQVVARWGTVDILVNNAQIIYPPHAFEEWTEEQMRASWESGPLGTWAFMVACFPYMKDRGGRIINTVSATGHGNPGSRLCGYASAKEAIRSLTRTGAREWGKYGITVNAISPMAQTETTVKVFPTEEERMAILRGGGPTLTKRWGDAEADIGRAVVYLAGPDAEIVTGCLLPVDGGCAI